MLGAVIESFVDLTYRGLALGTRIKLAEVRPTSALVEVAAPMPVGTQLAVVTDDGVTLEASVVWVHEQVAGAERAAGMVIAPVLAAEAAAAWWKARVALPDEDRPRTPTRSRPVTVRPRSTTERSDRTRQVTDRTPPPAHVVDEVTVAEPAPTATEARAGGVSVAAAASGERAGGVSLGAGDTSVDQAIAGDRGTREGPAIAADLAARVTAAAGVRPATPPERAADVQDERATVAMAALDQARLVQATRPDATPEATMRRTGEHAVVDDGNATTIMAAVDPSALGLDFPLTADAAPTAIGDEPSAPTIIIESGSPGEPTVTTESAAIADDGDPDDDGGAPSAAAGDKPSGRTFKRRRKRR
jgi:hypothetical protein